MQTWIRANIGKLIARFGGMALQLITAAEFAALEVKDPATLYTVTDAEADTVELYLGDKQISGGGDTIIGRATQAAVGVVGDISDTATIPTDTAKKTKRRAK